MELQKNGTKCNGTKSDETIVKNNDTCEKTNNNKNVNKYNEKEWPQVLAILCGSLSAFSAGLLFSWASPFTLIISQDKENYNISEPEASFFSTIPPLGMIVASLLFYKLNDVLGRKKTLLLAAIPQLASWLCVIFAKDIYIFYLGRVLSGIGDAAVFSCLTMYIGEVSTPKVRGSWGNGISMAAYFGQFVINIVGNNSGVQATAYIFIGFPVLFLLLFSQMPESPYFYILKDKTEPAKKSIRFLRGKHNLEDNYKSLKADVDRQMSESGSWKDLVAIKSNRRALIAGIFLRVSQQFGGFAVFATNVQFIFDKAGGYVSPQTAGILFSGSICILNVCAGFTLDYLGRRKAYFYSLLASGIILTLEAIYFFLDQEVETIDVTAFNWFPIVGVLIYVVVYSFGVGIVPTLMTGELFSASIKIKALCVLNIIFAAMMAMSTNVFHLLNSNVGLYCPFLVFGISCFFFTALIPYCVPETKGKTLEEIQQSLK